jgi:hypothetical protein
MSKEIPIDESLSVENVDIYTFLWNWRHINIFTLWVPTQTEQRKKKKKIYNSVECRLSGKICFSCVGTIRRISCLRWRFLSWKFSGAEPHTCGVFNILILCLSSRRWLVLCLACIFYLGAGTDVRRYRVALSIGPKWVRFTWRRRQNPVSKTLCFEK